MIGCFAYCIVRTWEVKTYSFLVTGRVQGVYFRKFVLEAAVNLGLTGYVLNRPDGNVYAVATGHKEALDKLEDKLRKGSVLSKVFEVIKKEEPFKSYSHFEIRYA